LSEGIENHRLSKTTRCLGREPKVGVGMRRP
jgi:hypothetical protein